MSTRELARRTPAWATALIAIAVVGIYGFTSGDGDEEKVEKTSPTIYKVVSIPTPKNITFAGEEVPMNILDVREKLDRELHVNTYWHSNTFLALKRAHRWFPVIEPILEKHGIPDDFKYLAVIESGLTNAVSPAGATGYWQFLRDTGKGYGLEINSEVDERYHVEKATEAACEYLLDSYMKYASWPLVAASYNMGKAGLDRRLREQKVESYWDLLLNQETARYVYRILAMKEIMSNRDGYGFVIEEEELYSPYETKIVEVSEPVYDLAQWSLDHGINYKILKTLNPWLRDKSLSNPQRKTYEFKVPVNPEFEK